MADRTLRVIFAGDAGALQRTLQSAEGGLGRLGGAATTAGRVIAAGIAVGATAVAGLSVAAVNAFSGFQTGMNEVFTLLPGISREAMDDMSGQVKDFAVDFGVLPDEVIPALYQSLSAGVPPGNVFDFLETAQKAALGGVTDLETAVDGISSVVNAYGADVVSAGQASDVMFTTVRLGKTTFEELSASLFNVIPTAASLGVSFEDVSTSLALLTSQGVPTSVATTQMRQMLVELGKEGGKTSGIFEDLAGQSFPEFIAGGGDLRDALAFLSREADESGGRIADMFGSVEAGAAAAALTTGQMEPFVEVMEEFGLSAGATQTAFEQMDQGVGRSVDRIKARLQVGLINLGEKLAPVFEKGLDAASAAFDKYGPVVEAWLGKNIPKAITAGQKVWSAAWPVIRDVVVAVADWISDNWPAIRDTILDVFEAVADWVSSNWPPVRDLILEVFGAVADWVQAHWPEIRQTIESALTAIGDVVTDVITTVRFLWEQWGDDITRFWDEAAAPFFSAMQGAFEVLQSTIAAVLAIIRGDWDEAWSEIQDIFGGAWDAITGMAEAALEYHKLINTIALDIVKAAWSEAWGLITELVGEAWDAVTDAVSVGTDAFVTFFQELPGRVLDALGDLTTYLLGKGSDLLSGLWSGISGVWDGTIQPWFTGLPGTVAGFFSEALGWLANGGKLIADGLWAGITGIWDGTIEPWFAGIGTTIAEFFVGAGTWLFEIGKDLIRGLKNGVLAMAESLLQAVKDVVTAPIDWAKSFLGIDSPSRLFHQWGQWLMEGLANGIKANAAFAVDAARAAANAVASVTADASAAPVGPTIEYGITAADVVRQPGGGLALTKDGAIKASKANPGVVFYANQGLGLANGAVITDPTLAWIGEDRRTTPEIVTPEQLMRDIFSAELMRAGIRGGTHYHLHGVSAVDMMRELRRHQDIEGVDAVFAS